MELQSGGETDILSCGRLLVDLTNSNTSPFEHLFSRAKRRCIVWMPTPDHRPQNQCY